MNPHSIISQERFDDTRSSLISYSAGNRAILLGVWICRNEVTHCAKEHKMTDDSPKCPATRETAVSAIRSRVGSTVPITMRQITHVRREGGIICHASVNLFIPEGRQL